MSINIERHFSEWRASPKRDRNNWAMLAVVAVVGAFVCGTLLGYALRDPGIQIAQLRLDAENSAKDARRFRDEAKAANKLAEDAKASAQKASLHSLDRFGLGTTRKEAQERIATILSEYKVDFVDSTEDTNGVKSTTAKIGKHSITLMGSDDNIASAAVVFDAGYNLSLGISLIYAGFKVAAPDFKLLPEENLITSLIAHTTDDLGCFVVCGNTRVSSRSIGTTDEAIARVVFCPNHHE